ncbi:MAG: thermopsin family protease [Candidatus Micrarchaeota archaeon]|nr:thermopsin family protease [Candidatus Micrarchaeota archaeon]
MAKAYSEGRKRLYSTLALIASGVAWAGLIAVEANTHSMIQQNPQIKSIKAQVPPGGYRAIGISAVGTNYQCSQTYLCGPFGTPVNTGEIVGYAKINSIKVSKDVTSSGNGIVEGQRQASLQLNAYVDLTSGTAANIKNNYIWVQNVMTIDNVSSTISFSDSIYPGYSYDTTINDFRKAPPLHFNQRTIKGQGTSQGNVYQYDPNNTTYPYKKGTQVYLTIKAGQIADYPVLEFGYAVVDKKATVSSGIYDTVTLMVPVAQTNYSGNIPQIVAQNSGGQDAYTNNSQNRVDLVFCGPYNGENAVFKSMNANLALYFQAEDGTFQQLNSMYASSQDTGEGTSNLRTTVPKTGYIIVNTGELNGREESEANFPIASLLRDPSTASNF